ncbi:methylated-DNA--[protein]-cysteine S-methyltransferase [Comamonas sp.]|uniref:methylated-DNA--[protein]-cysteine S-methyltransferase n=1 Tax=Comamonas sp. TaxID=34028 RepID=UPI0012CE7FD5|nr:MGMT family protein [Comamonas sp.]MPT12330.1 MGMT family protein [Comamonas sp.]
MNHAASLPFPGHALFVTRIGACGLAWNASSICAVQLPEASWGETRERMLLGLSKRHALQRQRGPAAYGAVTSVSAVPGFAVQAMAGVQCLLAGVSSQGEQGLAQLGAEAAVVGVLGDMRQAFAHGPGGVLPDLLEIALDEFAVPAFHSRVYAFTRALAPGRTSTYGEVASALGEPGAARAVGQALGANPFAPIVPCHRVLAAGRSPGGFSGGQGALTKLRMLEIEGGAWGGTQSLFGD